MKKALLFITFSFFYICHAQNKNLRPSGILPPCAVKEDFNYKIDACSPLLISLQPSVTTYNTVQWTLDDGFVSNNLNISHTFTSQGNHAVTLVIDKFTCSDTITKIISLNTVVADAILTHDTILCQGSTLQLRTMQAFGSCWSPVTYLDNPNSANPISTPLKDITYYYTGQVIGTNLIVNGDFSQGNTGFTSEYHYTNNNTTEGEYYVGPSPRSWNVSLSDCPGHTNGTDNMLLVNGAPVPGVNVWKQTVAVTPNTNYAFSTWVQALWPPNPAQLQFSINGKEAGVQVNAVLPTCTWTQFYTTWNSGNNTTAVISLVNKNTAVIGNDFALDDIIFAPVIMKRDSVVIKVDSVAIKTNSDTTVCSGKTVQLNTTGTGSTFSWSPSTGLSNANIANPLLTASSTTRYTVSGKNTSGCTTTTSVLVTVNPTPVLTKTKDTAVCLKKTIQLDVSGGTAYSWLPSPDLSNTNTGHPIASPTSNATYYVTATNPGNCSVSDSIKIAVKANPAITKSNDTTICAKKIVPLNATGGNTYSWQPGAGLSNSNIANPVASPSNSTTYYVTVTNAGNCSSVDSVRIAVSPNPTIIKTLDTTICHDKTIQLNVSGGNNYIWTPATTLNGTTIANPVASPVTNTTYYFTAYNTFNCSTADSIKIAVRQLPVFSATPSGVKECLGSPVQLTAAGGDKYQWQPAAGLDKPDIPNPLATPGTSTVYTVKIIATACGDSSSFSIPITILSLPTVSAKSSNDVDCSKPTSQLIATGANQYLWFPGSGLNDSTIASPLASPSGNIQYIVKGTDLNGCSNYDSIKIIVTNTGNLLVAIPNAFTPNDDGRNDCFGISRYAGLLQDIDFSVYDRFGVRVFHTTSASNCWDGRYHGNLADAGGYAYILKSKTLCGNVFKKGIVMLLR